MKNTFNIQDMQTYFRSYVPCHLHKKQPITNFCTDTKCNNYLCPQCVEQHSKIYSNHKVQSIKTCITKTRSRLQNTISILEDESNKNKFLSAENSQQFYKKLLKQMQEIKKGLIQQIQIYFRQKQNEVKKQTSKYSKVQNHLNDLRKQLSLGIKQLKILKTNLFQTNKTVQVIMKANKIDYPVMIEYYRNKIRKVQKQLKINVKLQLNPQKRQIFKTSLKDLVQVKGTNQNKAKKRQRQQFKDSVDFTIQNPYQTRFKQSRKQFITNVQPLSADRYFSKSSLLIQQQNYFKLGEPFLHFFELSKSTLHVVKIQELEQNFPLKWQIIPLNIEFSIPSFHKSIATEQGNIYLIGGTIQQQMKKSDIIYQYIPSKKILKNVANLKFGRSSHSLISHKQFIYIVGGMSNNQVLKQCQVYNTSTGAIQLIAPCIYPTRNSCLCYIQSSNSLIKLGGIFENGKNNDHVQVYNIAKNNWVQIDPIIDNIKGQFQLLSCSGWAPLSQNQVFIFGGYDQENNNQNSGLSFVVQYNKQKNQYSIKHINAKNLPIQQGFWSPQGIVHKRVIYVLQNIDGDLEDQCVQDQRTVLIFDGTVWKTFPSQ